MSNPRRRSQNFRGMLEDVLHGAFDVPLSITLTNRTGESYLYKTEVFLDLCEKKARELYADKSREKWIEEAPPIPDFMASINRDIRDGNVPEGIVAVTLDPDNPHLFEDIESALKRGGIDG